VSSSHRSSRSYTLLRVHARVVACSTQYTFFINDIGCLGRARRCPVSCPSFTFISSCCSELNHDFLTGQRSRIRTSVSWVAPSTSSIECVLMTRLGVKFCLSQSVWRQLYSVAGIFALSFLNEIYVWSSQPRVQRMDGRVCVSVRRAYALGSESRISGPCDAALPNPHFSIARSACLFIDSSLVRIPSPSSLKGRRFLKLERSRITWLVSHLANTHHPARAAPYGSRESRRPQPLASRARFGIPPPV
jgi:hypothetical protein